MIRLQICCRIIAPDDHPSTLNFTWERSTTRLSSILRSGETPWHDDQRGNVALYNWLNKPSPGNSDRAHTKIWVLQPITAPYFPLIIKPRNFGIIDDNADDSGWPLPFYRCWIYAHHSYHRLAAIYEPLGASEKLESLPPNSKLQTRTLIHKP